MHKKHTPEYVNNQNFHPLIHVGLLETSLRKMTDTNICSKDITPLLPISNASSFYTLFYSFQAMKIDTKTRLFSDNALGVGCPPWFSHKYVKDLVMLLFKTSSLLTPGFSLDEDVYKVYMLTTKMYIKSPECFFLQKCT